MRTISVAFALRMFVAVGLLMAAIVQSSAVDGPRAQAGFVRRRVGDASLQRRSCTFGLGIKVGDLNINFSLETLTDALLKVKASVADGLTTLANLDFSTAAPGKAQALAEQVNAQLQQALVQVPVSVQQSAPTVARDIAAQEQFGATLTELASDLAAALQNVEGSKDSDAVAPSIPTLQRTAHLIATLVAAARHQDASVLTTEPLKNALGGVVTSLQHLGPQTTDPTATLPAPPSARDLSAQQTTNLLDLSFGFGQGTDVGAGGGLTIGADGTVGGGFNVGVPGVGIGGGFNCTP